jgi:peptide/nickel transport system permease protein
MQLTDIDSIKPIPPSPAFPLGTLPINRYNHINIFYNIVWGARSALGFGLTVALLTALLGVFIGGISAYAGGWFNTLTMRVTDAFLAIPVVVGVVVINQLYSILFPQQNVYVAPGFFGVLRTSTSLLASLLSHLNPFLVALILFSWMPYARLINSLILTLKDTEYVEASRALGASHSRLLFRHLIPNSITPAVVWAARDIGVVVLLQASFSFIGMGGGSEWGSLLADGRNWVIGPGGNLFYTWWVFFPATLALVFFGIGWNLLGDGLNDLLNPQLS